MPADPPPISVVVASIVGGAFLDNCVASLESQARRTGAEVIVVASGAQADPHRLERRFPWLRVIHHPQRDTVPALRRLGTAEARAPIVAVIEEHCTADDRWLETALTAHASGAYDAVGGPVADADYRRLRDWVVYFCEYNGALPPAPEGAVAELNGANIAYRRSRLRAHDARLDDGYWEAALHPVLLAEGGTFLSVPGMVVRHRGPVDFFYYLHQRYLFSRAFAGARTASLPLPKRLAYLVAAPLVPALLFGRMASRVWQKQCRVAKFFLAAPLIVPVLAVLVAGEWVGYIAGPGDALSQVE